LKDVPISQEISADSVHIWFAETKISYSKNLIDTYLSWLDKEERERYYRFKFSRNRLEYLLAHALLRSCLSYYGNLDPEDWVFSKNPYGKPEVDTKHHSSGLRFSISHTEGLVACAITPCSDIGVDAEIITPKRNLRSVAKSICAPPELLELDRLSAEAWYQRFYDIWTLKEAYVKALGLGLSLPLQHVRFRFHGEDCTDIQFEHLTDKRQMKDWKFVLLSPTERHCLAMAVQSKLPIKTQIRAAMPGLEFQTVHLPRRVSSGVIYT
jgi:4'-phosphopantetheinyl transferase